MSETHITTDGRGFTVYTERASDRRRFTLAWGPPTRLGREGACAWWEGVPMGALVVKPRRPRQKSADRKP